MHVFFLYFVFDLCCRLLLYDEAFMQHRAIFEALDRTCRDVRYSDGHLFGGLTVVVFGDWRQILPVIIHGT